MRAIVQFLKILFKVYVLVNVHVAVAVVAMYYIAACLTGRPFRLSIALFLFGLTLSGYTLMRLMALDYHRPAVQWFYGRWKTTVYLLATAGILVAAYAYLQLNATQQLFVFVPVILSGFYNLRPGNRWLAWREVAFVKIGLVAVVWAMLTVLMPALPGWDRDDIFVSFFVFLWVLLLIIPFDMRDLALDDASLRTLPQIFKRHTIWIAVGLGMLMLFLLLQITRSGTPVFHITALADLLSITAVFGARKYGKNFYYAAFWVEGIPVITALALSFFCR